MLSHQISLGVGNCSNLGVIVHDALDGSGSDVVDGASGPNCSIAETLPHSLTVLLKQEKFRNIVKVSPTLGWVRNIWHFQKDLNFFLIST